jgi:RNA polymerase sigma-70 factor (ECF subfamily)
VVPLDDVEGGAAPPPAAINTVTPEVILLQSANRKLVNQALEELPVGYREVIVMREIEDMSYRDIATVAGIPIGTVMSRLSRGRDLLRVAIENRMRRAS